MRNAALPALVVLLFAACAPAATAPAPATGLPPVPAANGPLAIRVVYPTPGTPLPDADSSFVFGSVGTGRARLTIDGAAVEVARNGAFLAFVPIPRSGTYRLAASAAGQQTTATASYRLPPAPPVSPGAPARPDTASYVTPALGVVSRGGDTLATGSDVAIGRPTPTGTYRWFLPRGARLAVSGRRGGQLRVRLADTVEAWFPDSLVTVGDPTPIGAARVGTVTLRADRGWTDVRIPANRTPFLTEADGRTLNVMLYGAMPGPAPRLPPDSLVLGAAWTTAPGGARLALTLAYPVWGYKAWYDPDGALVLRVRRPPRIDPRNVLRGIRVTVDPGHPPAGATGPTGLREAQANLAVGLRLAERLRERGAEVLLTRSADTAVALGDRPAMAERWNADLLVSVHNNAFPDGTNPFLNQGTSTYFFQPWSAPLARALDREIVAVTRIPDLGAKWGNLALVRPTWMPSVLTESLFMMFPREEAALRNAAFVDRLAEAHVRGIESFLIGRLQEQGR